MGGSLCESLQVLLRKKDTFKCVKQPIAFPTIGPEDVWDFLGEHRVWFNLGDDDGPDSARANQALVSSFPLFVDRVRRLHTHQGVVFLQLEPLHRDDTPIDKLDLPYNGQVPGKPYVWDVMDRLDLYNCEGEFRVFRMYYADEDAGKAVLADALEIECYLTEADFAAYFEGRPYDEAMAAYRHAKEPDELC